MSEVFVRAIPVVEAGSTGVHLAYLGPAHILYSPGGWKIERRESAGPQRIPDACETVTAAQVKRGQELHLGLGTMLFSPGVFPAGGPCTVCTLELNPAAGGIHGVLQAGIAFMAAFRGSKAVTGLGPVSGPFDFGPVSIDKLVIYLRMISTDTILRLCRYQYDKDNWTNAKLLAKRQLPLRELMPGLTDEFAEAKSRLLPGESIDPARFRDFAELLRGVAIAPRGAVLARMQNSDEFDELGQLDPLRMVYSSPLWRRALGFGYFDNDPALVPGHSYDYRISAAFPSGERIYGFHTIPSGTPLPSDFYLYDCRFRLPSPPVVERSPSVPQTGLLVRTRRGIRLQQASALPWLGDNLAQFCVVIDLPALATVIAFELDAGHQLKVEAGVAWVGAFSAPLAIPAGTNPTITLAQPANQLRITGKGFLRSVIVAPGPTTTTTVIISPVALVNTPLPPAPVTAGARSLQAAASFTSSANQVRPRRPLGINVFWEPASLLNGWSIPGSPPPLDATTFQIERRLEPAGQWTPVIGEDNLVLGTREEPARESAIYPGIDLMQIFPEVPGPRGSSTRFSHDDLFLKGPDGAAKPNPPKPGTMLRYRVAAVDALGRRGPFVQTTPVRLEKHEPPPPPAGADVRTTDQLPAAAPSGVSADVLVRGADMSPAELALLGTSNNAVVLRWGWHAAERSQDPFARHFRIYLASPLDEVPCTVTAVSDVPGHPGEYQVTATCTRAVAADAAKGQYLDAGYPFFVDSHTGGTSIQLWVRTVVAAPGGGFRTPTLGATKLLLPYSSDLTRPRGWRERLLPVVPITSAEQYVFVLRDRLQLTDDHPRDSLWIGVSAADDQTYVSDTFVGPNPLRGNESAVAGVLCQGRKYLQPDYTPPSPTGPAGRIVTPEPEGGPIQFHLDLTPFLTGSGLPGSSLVFPERLHDGDLLAAYEVRNNQLVAVSEGQTQNVTIPNPADRAVVLTALNQGNYEDLDDRFLVLLASLHPFRQHLFRAVGENPLPTLAFEETLPSAAACYVYRFRRANAAGQLSADGAIPSAVVRVPSLSPGPTPVKETSLTTDPPHSIRVRIPAASGITHLLVFRGAAGSTTNAQLIRVPNRPDLHPSGHLRLMLDDGTILAPETLALSTLEQDARGWIALAGPQALTGPVRIWALIVTSDGMPSPLAGPWRMDAPAAQVAMPQLSFTVSSGSVHLAWTWSGAAIVPIVIEQSQDGVEWRRISPPLSSTQATFEVAHPGSPTRFRLRAPSALSNVVET